MFSMLESLKLRTKLTGAFLIVIGLTLLVSAATYLGQDLHLRLLLDGGQTLTAVAQGSAARRHAAGDDVTVAVAAAEILLLPK